MIFIHKEKQYLVTFIEWPFFSIYLKYTLCYVSYFHVFIFFFFFFPVSLLLTWLDCPPLCQCSMLLMTPAL